jgi:hypothetical protein
MTTEPAPASPTATSTDLLNSSASSPQPAAPAPSWQPVGMPTTPAAFDAPEAVAAREEIKSRIGDRDFYKALIAERERGNYGPASQAWAELHKRGYPAATAITSAEDVAKQQDGRAAEQWNSYISALKQRFPLSPNQEAELREGVINEDLHRWASEEKARVTRDKAFYRRLLDGDRGAAQQWGLLTSMLSLRPVKDYRSPHAT